VPSVEVAEIDLPTSGGVVFTGRGGTMTRQEWFQLAKRAGLRPMTAVSAGTRVVVTSEDTLASSKTRAAQAVGIPIITYERFHSLVLMTRDLSSSLEETMARDQ